MGETWGKDQNHQVNSNFDPVFEPLFHAYETSQEYAKIGLKLLSNYSKNRPKKVAQKPDQKYPKLGENGQKWVKSPSFLLNPQVLFGENWGKSRILRHFCQGQISNFLQKL
nr:MAG TPA: hypothetical protein [Caudoviricetes sp.]